MLRHSHKIDHYYYDQEPNIYWTRGVTRNQAPKTLHATIIVYCGRCLLSLDLKTIVADVRSYTFFQNIKLIVFHNLHENSRGI